MATKTIKSNKRYSEKIVDVTKDMNKLVIKTTEEVLNEAIVKGGEWQDVTDKAIKGSLKLAKNQQDLIFTALETIKGSFIKGSKRFKGMISNN